MPEETNAPAKPPAVKPAAPPPDVDLSAEISAVVETQVGETVRCVRIYGDHYRCNWWAYATPPANSTVFEITERRVCRSSFLKVRKTSAGLQIQDATFQVQDEALVK